MTAASSTSHPTGTHSTTQLPARSLQNCSASSLLLLLLQLLLHVEEEEEGLQGVFKRLRRNGHQLEKGLQMAQRGPSLK
jgi:hypothetical protein